MEKELGSAHIYKPVMAGVMAGFIATVLNIVYDVIYRSETGFSLPEIINVATIIFVTMLLLVIAGSLFALLDKYFKRGVTPAYIVVFVVLTVLGAVGALHTHRSEDLHLTEEFRGLLLGVVIITGACASFLLPYFAKKETMFI